MSLRSAPKWFRARFQALMQRRLAVTGKQIPAGASSQASYPPRQHVELRFGDGSAKVVDPRSPEASALQDLAAKLRQTGM